MNIFKQTKHYTSITRILLFSIGILLSCSVFAVKPSLKAEVKQNTLDISTNTTGIGNNTADISKNAADTKANTSGISKNANGIETNATAIADLQDALSVHEIGEQYAGGKIFYLDASGQHGLIAALVDQTQADLGIKWHNVNDNDNDNDEDKVTGATGDGMGAGEMNTAIIISTQIGDSGDGEFAAKLAADYSVQDNGEDPCTGNVGETCYGDWYLPSKFELKLLYNQKGVENGFADTDYWSSSESGIHVWAQSFNTGTQGMASKQLQFRVRAVRAF